jgi:metal-sulfur cluster biosynthetic enzyme
MDENAHSQMDSTTIMPPKPDLPENLVKELRGLVDPEIGLDVIALGLVRALHEDTDPVTLDAMLTTPFCPYGGWMIQQMKEISERALGKVVKVTVLPDLWDPNLMEDPGLLSGW